MNNFEIKKNLVKGNKCKIIEGWKELVVMKNTNTHSSFFECLDEMCTNIISTALTAIITIAVLGGLAILIMFFLKTVSTLLAGTYY